MHIGKLVVLLLTFILIVGCEKKEDRAQAFFDSGMQFYAKEDFDKARVEFLNAIQTDPTMGEAYFQLGLIAQKEGDIPLMYENMSNAMFLDKTNLEAKLHVAEILLINQQFDEVYNIADAAHQLDLKSYQALRLKAAARLGQKRYQDAEALIADAISINKNDDALHGLMAVIAKERGNNKKSIQHLNDAISYAEDPTQYLVLRSGVHEELEDYEGLLQDYRELIKYNPDRPQYVFAEAKILINTRKFSQAEDVLAGLIERDSSNTLAKQFLIETIKMHDATSAWIRLNNFIEEDPSAILLQFFKIRWLQQDGKTVVARRLLKKMLQDTSLDAKHLQKARALLAEMLISEGDVEQGMALVQQNLEANKSHEHSHLLKAQQDLLRQDYPAATASLRTVLRNNPNSVEGLVLLGKMYTESGSELLADDAFRQALDLNPKNVNAAMPVVKNLLAHQDLSRADAIISRVLKSSPNDTKLLMFYAQINLMQKDWAKAQKTIDRLKAVPDSEVFAELLTGRVLQAQEKYALAIERFKSVLDEKPDLISALQGLSSCYNALDRLPELIEYLESFQRAHPEIVVAHLVAAEVHQLSGNLQASIAEVKEALDKRPDWARGYANLAGYQILAGHEESAEQIYQKGIALSPNDSYLSILLAKYYEQANEAQKAAATYESIIKKEPANLVAINNYANLLMGVLSSEENIQKALAISSPLKAATEEHFLDTYAWALVLNGRLQEGEALLREALKLNNQVPEIRLHLGIALSRLERYEEARVVLKRAKQQAHERDPVYQDIQQAINAIKDKRTTTLAAPE